MRSGHSIDDIYAQYAQMVYNLCLNYLHNAEDAEEATQDVFVSVYQKIGSFEEKSSLKTWIYRITVNKCLDVLKSRKRRQPFTFLKIFTDERPVEPVEFNHPGVQLEDREQMEGLFRKIDLLPENQKTAVILKYLDDLPQKEIAGIMGISEKAVESLLQRAKQTLKK